jgi:hypothetical protein
MHQQQTTSSDKGEGPTQTYSANAYIIKNGALENKQGKFQMYSDNSSGNLAKSYNSIGPSPPQRIGETNNNY